ncbi:hypothetical protein HYH03_013746 [Edaphochlamys debaryana]|uniref:Sulfatase N-terminal domain-containing protein n=1 Tax=Edaphochlamys debaryana TaxID=47281 RepID=A0A835XMJ3_9CHLO|nr:hypothetical protein HYH03_013746 [Edaphochlamys debaryana]|eukprot:KAG2487607.1 hypothetical protein HYH03_013746 [Edaphochlamys debaryana]
MGIQQTIAADGQQSSTTASAPTRRPSFVIILTDDQDDLLNSTHPHFMPALNARLAQEGTRLSNFVVPTGFCCPARTSLLTGRYSHCHNLTANKNSDDKGVTVGGFRKFYEEGLDKEWVYGVLQAGGYTTHHMGKLLNGYEENCTFMSPEHLRTGYLPRGLTTLDALSEYIYSQYESCWSLNGAPRVCYPGEYQTDVLRDKAVSFIRSAAAKPDQPFLLLLAPTAPHRELNPKNGIYQPAARHRNLYAGEQIAPPQGPNFGVENPHIPWRTLDPGTDLLAEVSDDFLGRQRMLRAVDDMVDAVVAAVEETGLQESTYVFFSSDNGFHLGAFNLRFGKNTPIEEDVRIPFFARGPGIQAGAALPHQGNMIDIAPTLLTLAGLPVPDWMDGMPLPLTPDLASAHEALLRAANPQPRGPAPQPGGSPDAPQLRRDSTILEAWATNGVEYGFDESKMHFKALRLCTTARILEPSLRTDLGSEADWAARFVVGPGLYCYKYVAWCGPQELRDLYDLAADPYEIDNRFSDAPARILDRLDAVLSVLAHCSGASCRSPYSLLHPYGGVQDFAGGAPAASASESTTRPSVQAAAAPGAP